MRDTNRLLARNSSDSRKAITGIFLAVLLFASLFVAGVSYYVFANDAALASEQAALSKQGSAQGALSEDLLVNATESTSQGWAFEISAYNSGGIATTITAVFVTTSGGKALSNSSSGSEFLVGTPDLSFDLPLTLLPGEGTPSVTGCGGSSGCVIEVSSSACSACLSYLSQGVVYISVLTSRGNSFTSQYPPSSTGTTSTRSSLSTVYSTSVSTTAVSSVISTVQVTDSTTENGIQAGTNSLLLLLGACVGPSASQTFTSTCPTAQAQEAFQGGEVILTLTVTNYAGTAMSTYVNFQAEGSSGAGIGMMTAFTTPAVPVGAEYCQTNSGYIQTQTQTIPAGGTATFICTFTTVQGSAGGTLTFIGYAVGSYTGGSITSAEAVSNPIEVGNPESSVSGPFVAVSLLYASEESTTFSSASIVSPSNEYVIFQAEVTSTSNTPVYILAYSFLLDARIAQEQDYYIIPCTTSTCTTQSTYSSTASPYECVLPSSPSSEPPTDSEQSCITVQSGSTVYLDFAACEVESGTYFWGTSSASGACSSSNDGNSLAPPEAVTMQAIVVFDYYNTATGTWQVDAQSIPMAGVYFP